MASRAFPVSLCLGILASSASAGDLSIKSTLTQTVDISSNYFLTSRPAGETYRPTSTVTADVLWRTPTTNYLLYGDFSYYDTLGPGAADTTLKNGINNTARFSIDHTGKPSQNKFNFSAIWTRQDLASAQLADVGQVTARGEVETYALQGGFARQLTPRDLLTWSTVGSSTTFTDPTSTPFVNLTNTGVWAHRVNARTSLITTASSSWTVRDDFTNSETVFWRLLSGLRSELTSRLSIIANAGIGIVTSTGGGDPQSSSITPITGGTAVAFQGDLEVSYRLTPTTRASIAVAQSIVPDMLGNLSERQTLNATLHHDINRISSLALYGGVTRITGTNPSDFFTGSAVYSRQLAKEWRSNLSYTYRQRNDNSTPTIAAIINGDLNSAHSHGILVAVIRDFTILP